MAEDCTDQSSVATSSSSTPINWWDMHHPATSLSSWTSNHHTDNPNNWHQPATNPRYSSNSSCDQDRHQDISISITSFATNANSTHSALTVESSRRLLIDSAVVTSSNDFFGSDHNASDTQLWTHVLSSIGNSEEQHNNQEVGENFMGALSSKNMSTGILFEPACDYLKKLDNSWEYPNNSSNFNNMQELNHINETNDDNMIDNERLFKLSNNLISTSWSIALPIPPESINRHSYSFNPQPDHDSLCDHDVKQQAFNHITPDSGSFPCYGHDLKLDHNGKHCYAMPELTSPYPNTGNFADFITFSGRLGKPPLIDNNTNHATKPWLRSLNSSDSNKIQNSSPRRTSGRGYGNINHVKKKRSEDNPGETTAILKKPKQEASSSAGSAKIKQPKVKLGDRITTLQQIVSPFGKTDTASVLLEAIGYIKFLQEQVQLLSNPYMKTNSLKDPWGSLDRNDKGAKVDLRSRGLCLVPISCTPQVYRENTGSDYWTPTYRGCFYR